MTADPWNLGAPGASVSSQEIDGVYARKIPECSTVNDVLALFLCAVGREFHPVALRAWHVLRSWVGQQGPGTHRAVDFEPSSAYWRAVSHQRPDVLGAVCSSCGHLFQGQLLHTAEQVHALLAEFHDEGVVYVARDAADQLLVMHRGLAAACDRECLGGWFYWSGSFHKTVSSGAELLRMVELFLQSGLAGVDRSYATFSRVLNDVLEKGDSSRIAAHWKSLSDSLLSTKRGGVKSIDDYGTITKGAARLDLLTGFGDIVGQASSEFDKSLRALGRNRRFVVADTYTTGIGKTLAFLVWIAARSVCSGDSRRLGRLHYAAYLFGNPAEALSGAFEDRRFSPSTSAFVELPFHFFRCIEHRAGRPAAFVWSSVESQLLFMCWQFVNRFVAEEWRRNRKIGLKVCKARTPEDARAAAAGGADRIGVHLMTNARTDIDKRLAVARQARELGLEVVMVTKSNDAADITSAAGRLGASVVQLHRPPVSALTESLKARGGMRVIQVIAPRLERCDEVQRAIQLADEILIDSSYQGGTGRPVPWATLREMLRGCGWKKVGIGGGISEDVAVKLRAEYFFDFADVQTGVRDSRDAVCAERVRAIVSALAG